MKLKTNLTINAELYIEMIGEQGSMLMVSASGMAVMLGR